MTEYQGWSDTFTGSQSKNWARTIMGHFVPSLPYIEQVAVYDQIAVVMGNEDMTTSPVTYNPQDGAANSPFSTEIATFLCPSEAKPERDTATSAGKTNYGGNYGDFYRRNDNESTPRAPFQAGNYGRVRFATIVDGTSNTLLFAERTIRPYRSAAATGGSVKSDIAHLTLNGNGLTPPLECLQKASGNEIPGDICYASSTARFVGAAWGGARANCSGFHAMLPPNSVVCGDTVDQPDSRNLISAGSYHSGGVNVGLCDGSVRFVSDTVNCGDPNQTPVSNPSTNHSGKSPWGVWGAMSSIDGAESVNL